MVPSSHMRLLFAASFLFLWLWGHQVHFPQWLTDPFGPEGRRWKGRRDVCVRGYVHSAIRGTQCRGWSKAGRLCCAVPEEGRIPGSRSLLQVLWGDIAKMAMTAGTTHCSLGEMLKVICYKHPLCPRALERITPARPDTDKQLQVVILGPKLLASLGACVFCALHPSWWPASQQLLCKNCCLPQHTDRNQYLWYAGMEITTDQTAQGSLLHPGSLHTLHPERE